MQFIISLTCAEADAKGRTTNCTTPQTVNMNDHAKRKREREREREKSSHRQLMPNQAAEATQCADAQQKNAHHNKEKVKWRTSKGALKPDPHRRPRHLDHPHTP